MLQPKRTKFRKERKGKLLHDGMVRGVATRGNQVVFGSFGLKAVDGGLLSVSYTHLTLPTTPYV